MIDVVVEDDWRRTVARIPIMRPDTGFDNTSLCLNTSPAAFPGIKKMFFTIILSGLKSITHKSHILLYDIVYNAFPDKRTSGNNPSATFYDTQLFPA